MTASVALPENIVSSGPRPWWETRWFVVAMVLLAFVPLLYPPIPPLVDLPGHMGRYRVELDLAHSASLQRYYQFHWAIIGNLGIDLLIIPIAKVFGLELGVKLIVMCIPPLTVAGFLWVSREVHHRIPPTALFALPFAFGHPFLYGFVNYSLSMAFAFLAFGLWLRLARLGRTGLRAIVFVPISFLLFVTHTFGWGALGLLAYSAEVVRQHDLGHRYHRALLKALPHALVLSGPLLLMLIWRGGATSQQTIDWFDWATKKLWLLSALRDRWQAYDILSATVIPLFLMAETIRNPRLAFSRNLAASAIVLLISFLILPRIVFGSAFADMRLAPFFIATLLLAIRFKGAPDRRSAPILASIGLLFFASRIATTTFSLAKASNEQREMLKSLDHVEPGSRVLSLAGHQCTDDWAFNRHDHLGGMVIVRKFGLSNEQWIVAGANLLTLRNASSFGDFAKDSSQQAYPNDCHNRHASIDQSLATFPRAAFDYVWLIDPPAYSHATTAGMQLVWRGPDSMLYRVVR